MPFQELVDDYNFEVNVKLISSKDNLADSLTKIHAPWLRMLKISNPDNCAGTALIEWEKFPDCNKGRSTKNNSGERTMSTDRSQHPSGGDLKL